jgi:hypothetical protein
MPSSADQRTLIEKYGVNLAGFAYASACLLQASTATTLNMASAASMGVAVGYAFLGHVSNKVAMVGSLAGLAGTWLGVAQEVQNLQPLSLVGAGIASLGLFSIAASETGNVPIDVAN